MNDRELSALAFSKWLRTYAIIVYDEDGRKHWQIDGVAGNVSEEALFILYTNMIPV